MSAWIGLAAAALLAWIGLVIGRGFFWWPSPRLQPPDRSGGGHAAVVAVVPARNEAEILPETLPSVLAQDYPGSFRVLVVDDRSDDGTAEAVRAVAAAHDAADRVEVVSGEPLPAAWRGKVWAMQQGVQMASSLLARDCASSSDARTAPSVLAADGDPGSQVARQAAGQEEFIWFTDADIAHDPWVLRALVDRAEGEGRDLVSTMAKLRVDSWWDRLLVPAFVYFFAKLYPFRFVGNPKRRTAGAAGGCILVRRAALERSGGLAAMRSALIDDCALGRQIQSSGGRLWLGFSDGVRSMRGYGSLGSVWEMVARSAYTQLGYSPVLLVGTVVGMLFLYLLAPCVCIGGVVALALGVPNAAWLLALGGATWTLMALSFIPIVRHHGVSPWVARLLPVAGALYTAMTVSSAWRHAAGRGGAWKGRTYSPGG
jgi:hopene-associated glycosyltransferase HpnB